MIQRCRIADGWVSIQLVFAPRGRYGLSVTVWSYILVTLWVELFVSQSLIQGETTVSRKASTWSKGNKNNKIKIKLKLFYVVSFLPTLLLFNYCTAVFRQETFYSLAVQRNKYRIITTTQKSLNDKTNI